MSEGNFERTNKVKVYIANAITSVGGIVSYKAGVEKDPTLKNSVEDMTKVDESEFEIKRGEEGTQTQAIRSTYSYRIGIMLSENDQDYSDSKTLNLLSAEAELSRSFKTIQLMFQNPEPKMIADLGMTVSLINKKTGKVVKKQTLEN